MTQTANRFAPDTRLSTVEVAHVLTASVLRYVRLGIKEPVAVGAVAQDNRVTANCVRAAMRMVAGETGA
jgi:hypothetical protein